MIEEHEEHNPIVRADGEDDEPQSPADCLPPAWYEKLPILKGKEDSPFWIGWARLRLKTFHLIENKYFETAVIIMILLSSLALVSCLPRFALSTALMISYFQNRH